MNLVHRRRTSQQPDDIPILRSTPTRSQPRIHLAQRQSPIFLHVPVKAVHRVDDDRKQPDPEESVLAKPPFPSVAEFLDGNTFSQGDLVDDGFLRGREEDDGKGGEVFERIGEGTRGGPGGLVVFEEALTETQEIWKAGGTSASNDLSLRIILRDHGKGDPVGPTRLRDPSLRDSTVPDLQSRDPQVAEDLRKGAKNVGEDDVAEEDGRGEGREEDPFDRSSLSISQSFPS